MMKVLRKRKIKTDRLQIGDKFKTKIILPDGKAEKHTATAIEQRDGYMLCLLDDWLDEVRPMNSVNTTEGGWEKSELRAWLKDVKIKVKGAEIMPDELGDALSLLTLREACGYNAHWNNDCGQIEWMKRRKNRIAKRKDGSYEMYWLRSGVTSLHFAVVVPYGYASYVNASYSFGVRPCFRISDLKSRRRVRRKANCTWEEQEEYKDGWMVHKIKLAEVSNNG